MNNIRTPTVDIALATYNGERYLPELLSSIEQQNYSNWHLFVGDDGSCDNTMEILNRFAADHPSRTTILPATDQLGTTANFSRILQASRSGYVTTADQAHIWRPNKLETSLRMAKMVEAKAPPETPVLIHTDAYVTNEASQITGNSFWKHQHLNPEYGLKFKNLLIQNVITGCTILVNRSLLKMALPIPPESIMHDWWLGLTAAAFGKIGYISEPTLLYRQHPNNQLGAKRWSARLIANEAASGIPALRKRIEATRRQASAFQKHFSGMLKSEEKEILNIYTQLTNLPLAARRVTAAHRRLHKCGILRTIGFYTAL